MAKTYGNTAQKVKPAKISEQTLAEIGRLIRACAEIEDIIDLHICNLAEISESKAAILLGRTAVTRRLEIAKTLAKTREGDAFERHNHAFSNEEFGDIIDCRNAVAHGKLLGENDDGDLSFLTMNTAMPDGDAAIRIVASYPPDAIRHFATMAEGAIAPLEKLLKVEALREERLHKPLLPHRKAQPQQTAKQKHPPESSQA